MARSISLNYPQLVQARQDLTTHVPSDPTFMGAVGMILRAWIDTIIDDAKAQHEADQEKAKKEAEAAQTHKEAEAAKAEDALSKTEEPTPSRRR